MSRRSERGRAPAFKVNVALDDLKGKATFLAIPSFQFHPNRITAGKSQILEHVLVFSSKRKIPDQHPCAKDRFAEGILLKQCARN